MHILKMPAAAFTLNIYSLLNKAEKILEIIISYILF